MVFADEGISPFSVSTEEIVPPVVSISIFFTIKYLPFLYLKLLLHYIIFSIYFKDISFLSHNSHTF